LAFHFGGKLVRGHNKLSAIANHLQFVTLAKFFCMEFGGTLVPVKGGAAFASLAKEAKGQEESYKKYLPHEGKITLLLTS